VSGSAIAPEDYLLDPKRTLHNRDTSACQPRNIAFNLHLLREVIAAFTQHKVSRLAQPAPRTEPIVSGSEDLLPGCRERFQAPICEITLGRKDKCRSLIELSSDSPHGRLIQLPGMGNNSDLIACQWALGEGVDKGKRDLHDCPVQKWTNKSLLWCDYAGHYAAARFTP
jgi:hypothetical protein